VKSALKIFNYCLVLIVVISTHCSAQGLLIGKNNYQFGSEFFYSSYKSVFDMDGERKLSPKVLHSGVNLNFIAGLHERWNLLANVPFIYNRVESSNDPGGISKSQSELKQGDIELGLKFSLPSNAAWHSCFTLWQSLGTAYRDKTAFLHTGYADYNSRLYFDVMYKKSESASMAVYSGFNKRNKDNSDEFHAGIYSSFKLKGSVFLDVRADMIYALENQSELPIYYELGLFHNNARLVSGSVVLRYDWKNKMSAFVGYKEHLRGQYIFTGPVLSVGINFKINCVKDEKVVTDSTTTSYRYLY